MHAMAGTVLGIARRATSRAPMETVERTTVTVETGVEGDSRGMPGDRQVTVLTRESWQAACDALGKSPPWTTRRANILIEGLRVEGKLGRIIRIGELELEITGETDPCQRMEEQVPGLRQALTPDWRGGVTCRVRRPGAVGVGDAVTLVE
jgi:MOSC domain-containing protein YiiM